MSSVPDVGPGDRGLGKDGLHARGTGLATLESQQWRRFHEGTVLSGQRPTRDRGAADDDERVDVGRPPLLRIEGQHGRAVVAPSANEEDARGGEFGVGGRVRPWWSRG